MPNDDIVVWSEGTFLRPQHLQQQTRFVEGLVSSAIDTASSFGWGFSELNLDVSVLSSGVFGINSARGVFRDATPFNFDGAAVPMRINLSNAEPGTIVYLCTALRGGDVQGQEFATQSDDTSAVRYVTHSTEVIDNAAAAAEGDDQGDNRRPNSAPVLVGRLQTQLLIEPNEVKRCLSLPVARVSDVLANGSVRLDETFVAPVTRLTASPVLSHYVRELGTVVGARADQLARRVGDLVSGAEFSLNLLWLMVSNRYDPMLKNLESTEIHPAQLYQLLLGMAGELSTLSSPDKRPAEFLPYKHDELTLCFTELMNELRSVWSAQPMEMVKELPMTYAEARQTWLSKISDHNLLSNADFVLAANANISEDDLASRLPEQMIVAPVEQIDERASDLRLTVAKVKPRNVPTLNRWTYFHLGAEGKAWAAMSSSSAFAFFVDRLEQDFPELQLKFWAVPRR